MSQPSSPPASLRSSASAADAAPLQALCTVTFAVDDLPALLDPRGLRFQRLEWVGDAVLDALLAQHRHGRPPCCAGQALEQLASDVALAARADGLGLSRVLDWTPSPGRLADLVEALVGAAWLVAPESAVQLADVLVHPGLTLAAVEPATGEGAPDLRDCALLGSAVLEAAASISLLQALPNADEGQLSAVRHMQLSAATLVSCGRSHGLLDGRSGPAGYLLDHVQAAVGRISAMQGLLPGLRFASAVLPGPTDGPVSAPPLPDSPSVGRGGVGEPAVGRS